MTPWINWEDWKAGLYRLDPFTEADIEQSRALLVDPDHFREVAREMVREWPTAAYHNLRNMWSGRNAWVGQASCLYSHGAVAYATRRAWGLMSNDEQRRANLIAEGVRLDWERGNRAETLFDH